MMFALYTIMWLVGGVAVATQTELHRIDDPRPVSKAIETLEQECYCAITYEDPRYGAEDVKDVTSQVRRDGRSEPKVFVPTRRTFEFLHTRPATVTGPGDIEPSVTAMLDAFHSSVSSTQFRIVRETAALHVVPVNGSVLDTRITLPETTGSAYKAVTAVLQAVSAATGTKMTFGVAPINAMASTFVTIAANQEPAGAVLSRLLAATGVNMSWQLNFDYGFNDYGLNIHVVPTKE
jgi:hypothetical protein